ncbi:MAG: hypothetical protein IKJ58_00825 [Akkermansia sp.]|nr:hypothetical protein [Akkermansia sp.]
MKQSEMLGGPFAARWNYCGNFPYSEKDGFAMLNSGRAAFECILRSMPRPRRVLVPRFICDTILEPLNRLELPVERYTVNEQLIPCPPADSGTQDLLLLVNYFGLTGEAVRAAVLRHPGPVVVDATTALYSAPLPGIPVFYSPRKFGPLSDGGVASAPFPLILPDEVDSSIERYLGLLEQTEKGARFAAKSHQAAEDSLSMLYRRMSDITREMLTIPNWVAASKRRLENYAELHAALAPINRLQLPATPEAAPMCYPLVCGIPGLRDELIDAGIALPLYWPEVIEATTADEPENMLARSLLPLPLDHRCTRQDMQRLIKLILG